MKRNKRNIRLRKNFNLELYLLLFHFTEVSENENDPWFLDFVGKERISVQPISVSPVYFPCFAIS